MDISEIQETLVREITGKIPARLIYLFGSVLNDSFNDNSDIDCAVYCEEEAFTDGYFSLKTQIEIQTVRDLDLINLKTVDPVFATEIISTGKLFYENSKEFTAEFEMKTLSEYLTLEEDRRVIMEEIYNRGSIY